LGSGTADLAAFNDDLLYADETDADEILALCNTLPAFAERRLVIIRDIGALRAGETERLLPYLTGPVETTCLVLSGEKVDGRVKFFQAAKTIATVVDCSALDARAMAQWIGDQAASLGLRLDEPARQALHEASGGDLATIRLELEKLAAYVLPDTKVTLADVEAVQGADTGGTVWDFLEALGRKDRITALKTLGKVLDAGEPPLRLLGLVTSHWRQVWKTREQLARRVPEVGLARILGLPPFRIRGLVQHARNFSEQELTRSFDAFREVDSLLKGGGGRLGGVSRRAAG
jgi:DNA polymerase-3 subunit delta